MPKSLIELVRLAGIEPTTLGFGGQDHEFSPKVGNSRHWAAFKALRQPATVQKTHITPYFAALHAISVKNQCDSRPPFGL
jgi:hypothetical protein